MRTKRAMSRTVLLLLPALVLLAGCSKKEEDWQRMKTVSVAEVGKPAPDFELSDLRGVKHRLSDYISKHRTVVLEWFDPDCPAVKKHHVDFHTMSDLYEEMREKKVVIFAINSGAPGMPGSAIDRNKQAKVAYGIKYPILLDETGEVGRMYKAKKTPQVFIIGKDGTLIYSGAIDDEPTLDKMGEINYVKVALEQYLAGRVVSVKKTKPYGCRVKYAGRRSP